MEVGTKECKTCGQVKSVISFGSANNGKGIQPSCKECMKIYRARWGKENKDTLKAYDAERREKLPRKTYKSADKMRFWQSRSGICICCAQPIEEHQFNAAQLDHILPLSIGGTDTDENLALAHDGCNRSKKNKSLEAHWEWRFDRKLGAVRLTYFHIDNAIMAACYRT